MSGITYNVRDGGYEIFEIENFLTPLECDRFISRIDSKKNVVNFTNTGNFKNDMYIDEELTRDLFSRLPPYPKFKRPNKLIMTGMYRPGDNFGLHTDTGLYYNVETKERSKYTFLIYLNANYKGGETQFYSEDGKKIHCVIPAQGKALIFDIDLFHQGNRVVDGNKYWIGLEIIN